MSAIINYNYAATIASIHLNSSNALLMRSINRLSSGAEIVNLADDPSSLAVSMQFGAATRRQGAVGKNVANALSFLQTQDGVLSAAGKVLTRISELKTMSSDPTKSTTDFADYDTEFAQLQNELTSLGADKFNGISLFGSTGLIVDTSENGSTSVTTHAIDLLGSSGGSTNVPDLLAASGLGSLSAATISGALQDVATYRAENGGSQNHLDFALQLNSENKANLETANSRIIDVDVAAESTAMARYNVLVQMGASMLAQANQTGQWAMKLLAA